MLQLFLVWNFKRYFFLILILILNILIIGAIVIFFMQLYRRFMKKYCGVFTKNGFAVFSTRFFQTKR